MSFALSLPTLKQTVWNILTAAVQAVGRDGKRRGSPEALLVLAQTRMQRIHGQLNALIQRAIAGTLPRLRPKRPTPNPETPPIDRPEGFAPKPKTPSKWPRGFGWAVKLTGGGDCMAVCHVGALIETDSEMQALFAAAPQIARLIRPLYWMMAQTLPPALRKPEVMVPIPPDYIDGTYKQKGGGVAFTRHAMLVMQGWRAPARPPRRKPSPARLAERARRRRQRQEWAAMEADDEAKLRMGGKWRRPPPRSKKLGI